MPSSHCQVIFYLLGLELLQGCRRLYMFRQDSWQRLGQLSMAVVYAAACFLVAYSRVYLGYHDVLQVVAGAAAGLCVAIAVFAIVCIAARHFPAWQHTPVARLFRIKDTWHISDVLQFEYHSTIDNKSKRSD